MRVLISTLLGLEAFVAQELQDRGILKQNLLVQDGRVYIQNMTDIKELTRAVAIANIYSRCAERVYVELIYQQVADFDTLFSIVKDYPWEQIIPRNSEFIIERGYSRKSELFGIPSIQGMIKKAIVEHLKDVYHLSSGENLTENSAYGQAYFHFSFMNNNFSLCIDTSGDGLHKRGYRTEAGLAPIKETLAAALVYMAKYKPFSDECLYDPMCGSGTIAIEAAQIAINRAPGLIRPFAAEELMFLDENEFAQVRKEAGELVEEDIDTPIIFASDIDGEVLQIAKENARRAGVLNLIEFKKANVLEFNMEAVKEWTAHDSVLVVCNPPYGERLLDERSLDILFQGLKKAFFTEQGINQKMRLTLISSELNLESIWGFEADKRRKLYNGMLVCTAYQYFKETGTKIKEKQLNFANAKKINRSQSTLAVRNKEDYSIMDSRPKFGRGGDDRTDRPKFGRGDDDRKDRPKFGRGGDDRKDRPQFGRGGDDRKDRPKFGRRGNDRTDRPKFGRRGNDRLGNYSSSTLRDTSKNFGIEQNNKNIESNKGISFSSGAKRAREKKPRGF